MIHADHIFECMDEQVTLSEATPVFASYFENMGVCAQCLQATATVYALDNSLDSADAIPAYVRGFTVGLVLGRIHPVVKG